MKTYNGFPIIKTFQYLGSEPTYENFIYFVKHFLAPHMASKFIEEPYYKEIYDAIWTHRHSLLQMPRGHSKTELVGVWLTLYLAACQPYNPFYTRYKKQITEQMILGGDGEAKASWSQRIKHFFYESEYLQWLIPEGIDKKRSNSFWNESVIYLKNGHKLLIRAIGEKAIRGNHIDRLHADDLVTENSTMVDQAIKDKWDGAVDGTTTNKLAMVQVTGTPLRHSDILFHLKDKGYNFTKMPAILDWDKKIILSPGRWTWDDLMATKNRIGSVKFQSEYMLNPIDDSKSLIKGDWVRACMSSEVDLIRNRTAKFNAIYLGVDFAFEDRITSDRSAFVIIGEFQVNKVKYYQILDIITRKGMSVLEQFEFIKELHASYHFDLIGVEENSIKAVSKELVKYNLPLKRYWTGSRDSPQKDAILKEYETVSKRNLVIRTGNMFEQKFMIVPYKSEEAKLKAEELFNECISFAQEEDKLVEIGVHPDIPIALGYALEVGARPRLVYGTVNLSSDKPINPPNVGARI